MWAVGYWQLPGLEIDDAQCCLGPSVRGAESTVPTEVPCLPAERS